MLTMNTINTLRLYDAEQAAVIASTQGQNARRWCRTGLLPSRIFGKNHYVIAGEDLDAFLADHKAGKLDKRRKENKK